MSSPFIPVDVILHTYDISIGAARSISMMLLGTQIDLIPHTGIVYRNLEYFFGGGIKAFPPREVVEVFGLQPVERLILGKTSKTEEELQEFLRQISSRFTMESYDLFSNNCNHFSFKANSNATAFALETIRGFLKVRRDLNPFRPNQNIDCNRKLSI